MKDFISNQIDKQSVSFTAENFIDLSDTENSMLIIEVPLIEFTLKTKSSILFFTQNI